MHHRMDGDLKTRFQALKRVGPPIKNQGTSNQVDRLQAPKRVGPPIKNQGSSARVDSLQALG